MTETRNCPNCGAENKGLDLVETEGIYICHKCKKIIDSHTDTIIDGDQSDEAANN